jgi:hypothetical protein
MKTSLLILVNYWASGVHYFDQENRENQSDQLLMLVGEKGRQLTTNVEIMMRVPERRITWQAVSDDFRVGMVFLDSLVGGITKVTIKVRSIVEPVMLATALGLHLRSFKRFIELGTR